MADFKDSKEAIKVIEELVSENAKEYGHEGEKQEHPSNPLLNKYYYVHNEGRKRNFAQVQEKEFQMQGEIKNKKALTEVSEKYKELLGNDSGGGSSTDGQVVVKQENPQKEELTAAVEMLRSLCLAL